MTDLATWHWAGVLTAGVLIAALAVDRLARRERHRLKSLTMFWAAYMVLFAASALLTWTGYSDFVLLAQRVAEFTGWILIIQLLALMFFRVLLPRFGVEWPSIVADLAVGAGFIALFIASLRQFGVDPTSLVATSAVITGILALSLQPTLGNVIGGVALQMDHSVRVGDWLELADGRQGKVREIRWRHTVLETRDWDTIIVPNSSLLAANITILGKRQEQPVQHRVSINFNVDFRYRPARVIQVIEEALRAEPLIPGVASDPLPDCLCTDLASDLHESFAVYTVRFWLTTLDRDDPPSSGVRLRIFAALKRAEIPLAIPATQLFLDQDSEKRRQEKFERQLAEKRAALDNVGFLNMLTEDEHEHVALGLKKVLYSPGENIMRQGDIADWLYILVEGEVDVWVEDGKQRQKVASLAAPAFMGEMGLMTGEPRSATVMASGPVTCFKLFSRAFGDILAQRPEIAQEISEILAARGAELQDVQHDLDQKDTSRRSPSAVQAVLNRMQEFFGLS